MCKPSTVVVKKRTLVGSSFVKMLQLRLNILQTGVFLG